MHFPFFSDMRTRPEDPVESDIDRLTIQSFIGSWTQQNPFSVRMSSVTPIKVRGKKQNSNDLRHSLRNLHPAGVGKHYLPTISTPPTSTEKSCQVSSTTNLMSRNSRYLSSIESLPTELLEDIFFRDLNVSLPQASPVIGSKLSSKHVKSRVTFSFLSSPSSTEYPSASTALFRTLSEQAEAQSKILSLNWMNLQFLKDMIPDFIVHTLVRELGARKIRWMRDGAVVSSKSIPLIHQYLKDNSWRLDDEAPSGLPVYWEFECLLERGHPTKDSAPRRSANDTDTKAVLLGIGLRDGLVTLRNPYENERWGYLREYPELSSSKWRIICGVEGCRIPEKLLHGPWTEEKCEFLEIVTRGSATVDWVGTTDGETAKEGLLQAIEEQNPRAVDALITRIGSRIPNDSCLTQYYPSKEARESNIREISFYADTPVRRGVGIIPTAEHLRKAAAFDACRTMLEQALNSAADSDVYDNDEKGIRYIRIRDRFIAKYNNEAPAPWRPWERTLARS